MDSLQTKVGSCLTVALFAVVATAGSAWAEVALDSERSLNLVVEAQHRDSIILAQKRQRYEIIVVGSKVKEVIKEAGLRSDGELVQAIYATVSQPDIWPLVMRFGAEALAKRVWKPA